MLLIGLTRSNTEVQKIVTFQATFEKLLAVIEEQEGISGDIVVQDSLTLMHNLLRYNVSDQVNIYNINQLIIRLFKCICIRSTFVKQAVFSKFLVF